MSDFIKKAMEYKQQSSSIKFFISFLFGLLILFVVWVIFQTIFEILGLPATIIIIAIISYLIGRKL